MATQLYCPQTAHAVAHFHPANGLTCADLYALLSAADKHEAKPAPHLTHWAADEQRGKPRRLRPAQPGEFTWLVTFNN